MKSLMIHCNTVLYASIVEYQVRITEIMVPLHLALVVVAILYKQLVLLNS